MWRYASESEDEPLSDTEIKEWENKLMSQRHPLTCGGDRGDQAHRDYQATHGGDLGELVKSDSGLVCPVCGWKQPSPIIALTENESGAKPSL